MTDTTNNLKVVIVGHVDHGKSTIIGRLLADTNTLPEGKLQEIKERCRKNAKPFEYAFLLDALKDEQKQGITIDMARCFFKTSKRNYIIIDAPGHIEFLKNMCTGAAKADAALVVIDAKEGIQENSKRHGYLLSMLGIKQISILVNKIDLVNYDEKIFDAIKKEYTEFLNTIGVTAVSYIPVSGRGGDNIAQESKNIEWYNGIGVVEQLDSFHTQAMKQSKAFRMPIQDIYKFTENNDSRRLIAGTVESGSAKVGDKVIFLPSGKKSKIKSIENFNKPKSEKISAENATAVTLSEQIYIKPGELMCLEQETKPLVATSFFANIFWLSKSPMIKGKTYKLKIASTRTTAELAKVINVLDASELSSIKEKQLFERHDVGECIIETSNPIAFDLVSEIEGTGRFVIVDNNEIAGGGIILKKCSSENTIIKKHIKEREYIWEKGYITEQTRALRNHHRGKFVVITGGNKDFQNELAKQLEYTLFNMNLNSYYMGMANVYKGLGSDICSNMHSRNEHIRRLGELARILTGAGLIYITSIESLDTYEKNKLEKLNSPNDILFISINEQRLANTHKELSFPKNFAEEDIIKNIILKLNKLSIIPEYCI